MLRMDGVNERGVLLDLWHGECRSARVADGDSEAAARYVIAGTADAWRQVLTGKLPPLAAILTGRIRLTKGSFLDLIPYVNAAKELVRAAAAIEAEFPGTE